MKSSLSAGFTLLEIMVALAIIAIAMGAIIENTTSTTRNVAYLKNKTIANWVAMNQIALMRAQRSWGNAKTQSGRVEMAQREWNWRMQIINTDDPNIRRLEVQVSAQDDDQVLASATGFMGKL